MGLFSNLFGNKDSSEPLSPEEAEKKLLKLNKEIDSANSKINSNQEKLEKLKEEIKSAKNELKDLKGQIDDEMNMQSFGMYTPTYKFANSDLYKEELKNIRDEQKSMIKKGTACTGNMGWTVNGSISQGNKMVKDMQKLLLRAFNVECDDIIDNIKITNFEKSHDRIFKSAEQISKLGNIMSISITMPYIVLKEAELILALEFEEKKQEEKERLRELKEQQREEAKAQKEIEEARKKLEKEQKHYQNALENINMQIVKNPDNEDLIRKKAEIEAEIQETIKAISDVDYRKANIRAGYVYVISNIGAFGKDVYKIGMTRRLEPLERIDELGGASVPFKFDVHALIFTEDAPGLEAALHNAFEKQKVNKVNTRREFFHVTLDEIKKVVRDNFDKTVEWVDIPEAEQYRQSILLDSAIE